MKTIHIFVGAWCSGKTFTVRDIERKSDVMKNGFLYEEQSVPDELLQSFGTSIQPDCNPGWLSDRTMAADRLWTKMFIRQLAKEKDKEHIYVDYHPLSGQFYNMGVQYHSGKVYLSECVMLLHIALQSFLTDVCKCEYTIIYHHTGALRLNDRARTYDLDGEWLRISLDEISTALVGLL